MRRVVSAFVRFAGLGEPRFFSGVAAVFLCFSTLRVGSPAARAQRFEIARVFVSEPRGLSPASLGVVLPFRCARRRIPSTRVRYGS